MKKGNIASVITAMIAGMITGCIAGGVIAGNIIIPELNKSRKLTDKNLALFLFMNKWLKIKQAGRSTREYFEKKGYKSIAIYGMSHAGKRLLEELEDSGTEVKYAIDRNGSEINSELEVYLPESNFPETDAIVVSAVYDFKEIYSSLKDKVTCPIISLEDVLYSII